MKLKDLQQINEIKLNNYLKMNNNPGLEREIEIHKRIKTLFEKYEALFFQISMNNAVKILSKLVPKEDIEEVYAELISVENFKNLRMN